MCSLQRTAVAAVCQRVRRCSSLTAESASKWESVIGLEIHAKITSESKLFSGSSTAFNSPTNCQVAHFDAALPGTLPVLNRKCIEVGVKTALALGATLNKVSCFDRKHYFYADLPAGYQITQQRAPLAVGGGLEFAVFTPGIHKEPYTRKARIKQLQIEQDSGKSLHDEEEKRSLIDLNRAGVPLMELVFEPDLQDGEEAGALVKDLCLLLKSINACDCRMEEGSLRVDANISMRPKGSKTLGTRTEVKNLNSIRCLVAACESEIRRQTALLEAGGEIVNETRGFSAETKETVPMRDKEVKQDYRFLPEPNLLSVRLVEQNSETFEKHTINIQPLRKDLPPTPSEIRMEIMQQYKFSLTRAIVLVQEEGLLTYFEECIADGVDPKTVYNIIVNHLKVILIEKDIPINECILHPSTITEIARLYEKKMVSHASISLLLNELYNDPKATPLEILKERDLLKICDREAIAELCEQVIKSSSKQVRVYKEGKNPKKATRSWNALLTQVNKLSDNRADMAVVVEVMREKLGNT